MLFFMYMLNNAYMLTKIQWCYNYFNNNLLSKNSGHFKPFSMLIYTVIDTSDHLYQGPALHFNKILYFQPFSLPFPPCLFR